MRSDSFVAVALLTQRDLEVLGSGLRSVFPLTDTTDFTALLAQIDEVDRRRKPGSDCRVRDGSADRS